MKTRVSVLADTIPLDPASLPEEWSAWAEEPGQLLAIDEGGRPVGRLHAVVVGPTEGWLEGLWVRQTARGAGVGHRLVSEAEDVLRGYGVTTVRTAIPAREYAAIAVAERAGFVRYTQTVVLTGAIDTGPTALPYDVRVSPARTAEAGAMTEKMASSEFVSAWRGLVPLGWRFRRLRAELVRGLIKDGRVLRSGEALEGVVVSSVCGPTVVVTLLDGPRAHQAALVGLAAERAREGGATRLAVFAPDAASVVAAGVRLEAHPWCPDGLVIVEKALGSGGIGARRKAGAN